MFTVIKNGKEVCSCVNYRDALKDLLFAYDEQTSSRVSFDDIEKGTFIVMTMDDGKTFNIDVLLARDLGYKLSMLDNKGRVTGEQVYHGWKSIVKHIKQA